MVSDREPRGYWGVVAALVGWIALIGASPPPEPSQNAQDSVTAADISNAANAVTSTIRDVVKAPEKDDGCEDRKDRRESDLCAQWKAADSASDAARYALWGLGFSVVGTMFLILTLAETRSTSRRQLRAYVSIKPMGLKIAETALGKQITASLKIKNGGQTPAYDVIWSGNIVCLSVESAADFFADDNEDAPPTKDPRPTLINSLDDINADLESVDPIPPDGWLDVVNGKQSLYLYGVGEYRDVFGRKHCTRFCYLTEHQPLLLINDGGKLKKLPLAWLQAPFFNSAT